MNTDNLETAKEKFRYFFQEEGRMPSYSEICDLFDYKSKNAAFRLVKKLIEVGILAKSSGGKLIPQNLLQGLRVLGTVQAGFPSPAEEQILDTLSLDDYLVNKPEASFLLRVSGDSMIDEGIKPDDLVVVERGRRPKLGNIVLAQIDNEWTLKYYSKKNGKLCLLPGNKNYPTLYPKTELKVGGVVTSVVRKYM